MLSRLPASELMTDPPRLGIGLFSRRKDIADWSGWAAQAQFRISARSPHGIAMGWRPGFVIWLAHCGFAGCGRPFNFGRTAVAITGIPGRVVQSVELGFLALGLPGSLLVIMRPASAHDGPLFPIIEGKRVGPWIVALWTHADVGIGTFFAILDAPPGVKIPGDLKGFAVVRFAVPCRCFSAPA
jgi:hypothetical protein